MHCKILFLTFSLFGSFLVADIRANERQADHCVVGYLPHYRARSWSPEQIGPVTDLVLFAAQPNEDGSLDTSELPPLLLEKAMLAKQRNGCRVLLCVGGWERSNHFAAVVADDAKRNKFVNAIAAYCQRHTLDGVDFDWEHPRGEEQRAAYQRLLRETRQRLAPAKRIVTIAVAPWVDLGKPAYDAVDRIHLMSYDHAFPQATLEKSREDLARMEQYGCPPEKIALGIPFYGRRESRAAKTYGQLSAGDVDANVDQVDGFAFNGPATVGAKVRLADEQGLAGVMIWELGQDAEGEKSLLDAIRAARE